MGYQGNFHFVLVIVMENDHAILTFVFSCHFSRQYSKRIQSLTIRIQKSLEAGTSVHFRQERAIIMLKLHQTKGKRKEKKKKIYIYIYEIFIKTTQYFLEINFTSKS